MFKSVSQTAGIIALSFAIAGCDSPDSAGVEFHHITASSLANSNGKVVVDLGKDGHVYVFDYSRAPLDFDQIEVICPNQQTMAMTDWIEQRREENGTDLRDNIAKRFAIAFDPSDFGQIEEREIELLEREGSYMQDIDGSGVFGTRTSALAAGGWREYVKCSDGATICIEVPCD